MEARKITVIQTKGQGRTVFLSGAEKLGELKSDLRENKISYDDMTFYEGISRTELVDDQSILPKDIPFKGQITNELIIYLTVKNKKIRSGMAMTRSEVYAAVKANNLGDAIKEKFGKNFTQVTTSELETFITESTPTASEKATIVTKKTETRPDVSVVSKVKEAKVEEVKEKSCCVVTDQCKNALQSLVNILVEEATISDEQADEVMANFGETIVTETVGSSVSAPVTKKAKLESPYSDSDLSDLAPRY